MHRNFTNFIAAATTTTALLVSTVAMSTATAATFTKNMSEDASEAGEVQTDSVESAESESAGGLEKSDVGKYPWLVGIIDDRLEIPRCSGVLLNNLYVLTTASCVYGRQMSSVQVILGENDWSKIGNLIQRLDPVNAQAVAAPPRPRQVARLGEGAGGLENSDAIIDDRLNIPRCSGVLLNNLYVLTTASCVQISSSVKLILGEEDWSKIGRVIQRLDPVNAQAVAASPRPRQVARLGEGATPPTTVPEPSGAIALGVLGLGAVASRLRRRSK